MKNFQDQQIYRETHTRFSNISLTELTNQTDRSSQDRQMPLLGDTIIRSENKQLSQQKKVQDFQEWSVQKSQHLNLINDLSSSHNRYNDATQYWIDKLRRLEKVNEVQIYMDPNERVKQKLINSYKYRQKFICEFLPIIERTSTTLLIWGCLIVVLIVMLELSTLCHFYFTSDGEEEIYWQYWMDAPYVYVHAFIMICFVIDLVVEFHIAYFHQGTYITSRYLIARNYLQHGFICDIVPLLMMILTSWSSWLNCQPYFHYLIVLKFQQIINIDTRIRERLQLHRKTKAVYLIIRLIIEMYILVNVFASIFYRAGIFAMSFYADSQAPWDFWLRSVNGNFPNIIILPKKDQYILSMYWSFATMTTVAYGDITPMNPIEIGVAQFAMMGAVFLFAFNVQIIFEIINDYRETRVKFQKYQIIMNRFMRDKQITYQLQNKIKRYLDHIWSQQRAREESIEDLIINQLAPGLKEELMYESYGRFLISIPWFREIFSFDFVKELSQDVEEVHYSQSETIFLDKYVSQDDNALYFLNQGQVELFVNIDQNHRNDVILSKIRQGSCFGQNGFITGQERTCSARSVSYSQTYRIRRNKFLERLQIFPADYEKFCYLRDQIQFNKRVDLMNVNCLTCQASDHVATQCPLSHYVPVSVDQLKEQILKKIQDNKINPIQLRTIIKRRTNKRRLRLLISEDQIKQAEEMDQEEDNPEHFDLQIAKLIKLQKLIEYYDEQINESIDTVKNYEFYCPSRNIDHLLQIDQEGQNNQFNNNIRFTVLSKPKKRGLTKKFDSKMVNQLNRDSSGVNRRKKTQ